MYGVLFASWSEEMIFPIIIPVFASSKPSKNEWLDDPEKQKQALEAIKKAARECYGTESRPT